MKIEMRKVSDLIPYHNNPRINDGAVNHVASSIKEFGFKVPIVVDAFNVIVTGHTRLKAAQKLGLEEVPCIEADDLTPAQIKAFRLADNKTSEFSTWDLPLLDMELAELKEMDFNYDFGFDDDELFTPDKEGFTDEDAIPEEVEPICQTGDLWQLGEHRLLCGDATKKEDVEQLMDGEKADMVFTDPPYNIDYSDMSKKFKKIENDNMTEDKFINFLIESFSNYPDTGYVCCNWQTYSDFFYVLNHIGKPVKSCIVWDKTRGVQNLDKYFKQHEFILYFGKFGGEKTIRGDVWSLARERSELHPTQKPIELCEMAINDNNGKIVFDNFLGSGSTLIACEKTNRKCYGMEIDPHYSTVVLQRWADFTGKDPVREDGVKFSELKNDK